MNQDQVWEELLPVLRRYVESRKWNISFLIEHLQLDPSAGLRTIGSWLVNYRRPTGDTLVRLWYVMHALGFRLSGFDKLDENVRIAGLAFAFYAADCQEILRDFFGLSQGTPASLYQILRGDRTPQVIKDVRSEYRLKLTRMSDALAHERKITQTT